LLKCQQHHFVVTHVLLLTKTIMTEIIIHKCSVWLYRLYLFSTKFKFAKTLSSPQMIFYFDYSYYVNYISLNVIIHTKML